MANWSNPTLTSLYTDFVTEVKNRDVDLALGLDPATTSPTNVPANAIRWNSASFKYQKWDGSTWNDLSAKYIFTAVEVSGSTVPVNGMYLSTTNTLNFSTASTASRLTIDGSGNVNIDSGTFYVDAVGNRTGVNNTSPGSYNAAADDLVVGLTGDTGVTIASTNQGSIFFADGTTGGAQQAAGYLYYLHSNDSMGFGTANTLRMTLDASGNLGLGVAPSTRSVGKALEVAYAGCSLFSSSATQTLLTANATYNSNWLYATANPAAYYQQNNGIHSWHTSTNTPSAGAAITFTQAMTLNASGSLLLGTTNSRGNFYNGSSGYDLYMQVESVNYGAGCSYVRNSPDSASAVLIFGKTRSGSLGGNAVVANNDSIGTISFQGSDGSEFVELANIVGVVDGAPGANDMPGRLVFKTTADGAASPTERMRITSSGGVKASNSGSYAILSAATSHEFVQTTAGVAAFHAYHTASSGTPYGYYFKFTNQNPNNTTSYVFTAVDNTDANIYTINSNGTVTARSDAKFKKNIETTRDGYLEDLARLRVVKYNWRNHDDDTPKELGFIAQEVEQVFPGLVSTVPDKDDQGNETGEVSKSIKTSVFTPMLVKALQEAMDRIETLEAKVAALESR